MDLSPIKATRDFYQEEVTYINWLFDKFRKAALQGGFVEFDIRSLEHKALNIRKAGDASINQLIFLEDKMNCRGFNRLKKAA